MATVRFVQKIEHLSKIALPLELYPRVVRPLGILTVWAPEIIPHVELAARAETSLADGQTEPGFSIAFDRQYQQWKQFPDKSWQFQGGDIVLGLQLMIYITNRYEQETYWDGLFQLILTHELKHWADAIDIVTNRIPKILKEDADLKRLMLPDPYGKTPVISDAEYQKWFVTTDPVNQGTLFENNVGEIWLKLFEEQHRLTDSASEYRRYSDNVYWMKNGHPENVIWPK